MNLNFCFNRITVDHYLHVTIIFFSHCREKLSQIVLFAFVVLNFRAVLRREHSFVTLEQECQTQIWVVNKKKLTAGHSLELHMTLCVNFRHILVHFILKWTKINHILWNPLSFQWQFSLNRSQRAALNKPWGLRAASLTSLL